MLIRYTSVKMMPCFVKGYLYGLVDRETGSTGIRTRGLSQSMLQFCTDIGMKFWNRWLMELIGLLISKRTEQKKISTTILVTR